jgi:hypothetical protein
MSMALESPEQADSAQSASPDKSLGQFAILLITIGLPITKNNGPKGMSDMAGAVAR